MSRARKTPRVAQGGRHELVIPPWRPPAFLSDDQRLDWLAPGRALAVTWVCMALCWMCAWPCGSVSACREAPMILDMWWLFAAFSLLSVTIGLMLSAWGTLKFLAVAGWSGGWFFLTLIVTLVTALHGGRWFLLFLVH